MVCPIASRNVDIATVFTREITNFSLELKGARAYTAPVLLQHDQTTKKRRGRPISLRGRVRLRRSDMKLNELRDNDGATKKAKRVGRGVGSGKGKTAGRGMNGQKSRSGVAINGFEGGQMPLYQRLPKRGFNKPNRKAFAVVNLGLIQKFIDDKKIDAQKDITEDVLVESGLVRRKKDGIRVLAKGEFSAKAKISVTGASKSAVDAVEKAGGSLNVTTTPESGGAAE